MDSELAAGGVGRWLGGALRRAGSGALGAVLPARCLGCGKLVDAPGALCGACWNEIDFLAPPFCACCGIPFEVDPGEDLLCGLCLKRRPAFGRARAVFRYDEESRRLILGFKHGDRLHGAPAFGQWMARAGAALLDDADWVAPVPLHWTRLFRRRYNQAALLAHAIGRARGVPVVPDLLLRRRRTPSQGGLNATERQRNMRGAFALKPTYAGAVEGKRVVLVDDVLTTGATVNACAETLIAAGAAAVDILTLARVARAQYVA
ncbi:MAG TPA: ComF family protein [Alphaproteobacteria bacterium]|nr:ComF family protein [Alphaproteobacteria bacterium]